jgi:hypothetical protein
MTRTVTDAKTLYEVLADFRILIGVWVEERRCPLPLVDLCLEYGLESQAAACRWAATEPDRKTPNMLGPDERGGWCGPYPTQNNDEGSVWGTQWFWRGFYEECCWVHGDIPKSFVHHLSTPTDAILWLLDNWKSAP